MKFILLFLLGCFVVSCGVQDTKLESVSQQVGDTLRNDYAEAFRMIQFDGYTQIDIILPESQEVLFRYGIGENVPGSLIELPKSLSRLIALSSTHLGMISELDKQQLVVGVSDARYLCNPIYQELVEQNMIKSLGDIGATDFESFVALNPDLIMHSGFDLQSPALKKLEDLGLSLFVNFDWRETTPLGRLEWIKVLGVLLDEVEQSNEVYDKIKKSYLTIVDAVSVVEHRPTVIMGTVYGDIFNAPAGESYKAQLIRDAGGDYVYAASSGTGSLSLSMEELIMQNRGTEIWLDAAGNSVSEILSMNKNFELLSALKNQRVYSYMQHVNCYWEESIVKPHLLLSDFVKIFQESDTTESMVFYLRIAED
jgi:iron complex transport system substrate-binding protein